MTRKYKVSRPDPAKLLERMRDAAAIMHSYEIEIRQTAAEAKALVDEANAMVAKHRERIAEIDRQNAAARENQARAREDFMKVMFESLAAIIEDASS